MMIVASNSITVSNVNDGTIVHIAYANSADGKDGFYVGGGRNLLQGTGTASGDVANGGGDQIKGAFNGYDAIKTNGAWRGRLINLKQALGRTNAKAGDWFTISVYVKADKQIDTGSLGVYRALGNVDVDTSDGALNAIQMSNKPITTQWQQYAWSFQINNISLQRTSTRVEYNSDTGDNWIYWAGWMLEEGRISTPWSPAPSEAHPIYMGTYTDYTQADSLDPTAYLWSQIKGDDGKDGVAGKDGLGIKSTAIAYQLSSSGTTTPTGTWSTAVPALAKGQYLWTRTTLTYTDNSSEPVYSVSYVAKDGNNGSDGIAGKDGVGITATAIAYAGSTSGTTKPTTGWSSTIPTVAEGNFLWTRTTWTYSDGTNETGYSVAKMGAKGDKGDTGATGPKGAQGLQGPKGADGKTYYTWLKYATTPTSGMSDSPTGKEYIGLAYNKTTATESSTYSDYAWSLIKGEQGVAGGKGADGKTYYTWIKYGTSATGAGMSDSPTGKTYIGIAYNKTTATESNTASDYTWSLIQGPKGDNGLPAYVHNAWAWSADGTDRFTTVYPGVNLMSGGVSFIASSTNYTEYPSKSAGALNLDIDRLNKERTLTLSAYISVKNSQRIATTNYFRIGYEFGLRFNNGVWGNAGIWKDCVVGETFSGRVIATYTLPEGADVKEFPHAGNFYHQMNGDYLEVSQLKIEYGNNSNPVYTPAPSEDPSNAYPHYMGTYSDNSPTASTNPADYHWQADPTWLEYSKVNEDDFDNATNTIYEALEDKANSSELADLNHMATQLDNDYKAFIGDGGKYSTDLEALESRATELYKELGEKILGLTFINTWFKVGEEGLAIGTEGSNIKMLLSNDALSFIDGGQTVAYFTQQSFYINRGAVVKSLQVGSHAMISIGAEDTVIQFVGGATV